MTKNTNNHRLDLVVADLLVVNLGLLVFLLPFSGDIEQLFQYFALFGLSSAVWIGVSLIQKIYKWKERVRLEKALPVLFVAVLSHFSLFWAFQHFLLPDVVGYDALFRYLITLILFIPFVRLVVNASGVRQSDTFNYIIVGGKATNIKHIFKSFKYVYQDSAHCLGRFGNTTHDFIENIGTYDNLAVYLEQAENLQKVFYIYSELSNEEVRKIMHICQTKFIDFEIIPRETDLFPRGVKVEFHDDLPILVLKEEPLFRLRNKLLKRTFDLLFSTLVILLIFPWLLPIIAILIKMESKGPVFFIQDRSGYKGKAFPCFKFRTMTVNTQADLLQATKNDSRITKIGAFLRKSSLDEFPQFINVFLGQMSVVGPRPHMLRHTVEYSELISDFMIRHQVKPGITGWAQVNGYRGPTEQLQQMENRVKYDVWYVENWSFWLDIKCVIYTVFNALKGEENAF
jgi:putative colanic acid biosysnthesis UDP-glucose lipid carrier transferase